MIGSLVAEGPARVLIVDANRDFAANLADIARLQGMEPVVVRRLEDALDQMARHEFDVALVDYRLPDGSGTEFLARARDLRPHLVCVIVTAFASQSTTLSALNEGAFAFVTKDADADLFLDALHRAAQTAALRRENDRLVRTQERILLAIPDLLMLIDGHLRILSANHPHALFCPSTDGLPRALLDAVSPLVRDRVDWSALVESARSGDGEEVFLRVRDPEGKTRTFAIRCTIVGTRAHPEFLLRVTELTTRLELERRLSDSEALARVGRLVAMIAHEMRNPITGIRALAQLLRDRFPTDDDDRESVDEILTLADRMSATLADLLTYARPPKWKEERIALEELLAQVVTQARRWPSAEGRTVKLQVVEGGRQEVRAERDRLTSVYSNLVENALQATPERGTVVVTLLPGQRVAVEDSGCGVPEEDRERIFEPFVTGRSEGTGLGLAIVRGVVEGYGGSIEVGRSEAMGGARFEVRFPAEGDAPRWPGPDDP